MLSESPKSKVGKPALAKERCCRRGSPPAPRRPSGRRVAVLVVMVSVMEMTSMNHGGSTKYTRTGIFHCQVGLRRRIFFLCFVRCDYRSQSRLRDLAFGPCYARPVALASALALGEGPARKTPFTALTSLLWPLPLSLSRAPPRPSRRCSPPAEPHHRARPSGLRRHRPHELIASLPFETRRPQPIAAHTLTTAAQPSTGPLVPLEAPPAAYIPATPPPSCCRSTAHFP